MGSLMPRIHRDSFEINPEEETILTTKWGSPSFRNQISWKDTGEDLLLSGTLKVEDPLPTHSPSWDSNDDTQVIFQAQSAPTGGAILKKTLRNISDSIFNVMEPKNWVSSPGMDSD